MSYEPTNAEILEAVNALSRSVDEKFVFVDQRFEKTDRSFGQKIAEILEMMNVLSNSVDGRFALMDQRFEQRTTEILEAMNDFAHSVDGRFSSMDQRFAGMDQRFDKMDQRFAGMDQRFDKMDQRFDRIEGTMVTKDYLDDKLADLRGDLVSLLRKEDEKLDTLVDTLHETKIITGAAAVRIAAMGPFAQK